MMRVDIVWHTVREFYYFLSPYRTFSLSLMSNRRNTICRLSVLSLIFAVVEKPRSRITVMSSFQYIRIKLEYSSWIIDWGYKVNSGIGLSHRRGSPCSLAGWYNNPYMPELTLSPQSESMNSTTVGGGFRPHLFSQQACGQIFNDDATVSSLPW